MNSAAAIRPLDVRLMDMASLALSLAFAGLVLVWSARGLMRWSGFDIQGITVVGDTRHSNSMTLRANVAPRIAGTFFSVDLARVRAAFEAVPWVRRAEVRRVFPNRLQVQLQEHQPVGLWGGEGEQRLINDHGEVFEANVAEVEQDNLPTLIGPDGSGPDVLAMYRALQPLFKAQDLPLVQLAQSGRGGWSARLENGAAVELGSGSVQDVQQRVLRLLRTLTQVAARYARQPAALESADLRHENGYAIRLRGVTTLAQTQTQAAGAGAKQ